MNECIRVLHVIGTMNRGGAETMIMNLYRNIDRNLIQFDFIENTLKECDYDTEIRNMGGIIYKCPHYNGKNHFQYIKWWKDFFKNHKGQYEIIHGHLGSTAAVYLKIAKKNGLYTIAHSHNTDGTFDIKQLLYKFYSYPTRYVANYFFGCSYNAIIRRFGNRVVQNNNFSILNNAIDIDKYIFNAFKRNEIRNSLNFSNNDIIIGHVGRFEKQKNHEFLIDVYRELYFENHNIKLVLLGDGGLKESIQEKVRTYGLTDSVNFIGVVNNVEDYLNAFDLFIFPSLYEGLSVAAIEAQASGLRCVFSDTVDLKTDITGNVTFISLNESAQEWKNTILPLLNNNYSREVKDKMLKSGYDIKETSKWLQEFYMRLSK